MKRLLIPAFLLAFAATPAFAAHWNVDYSSSKLGFGVQWSGQPFGATFKKWNAVIDFDPGDLAHAHVTVTIDLASEVSDSPDNDDGVQGAQGFQVSQFPAAKFEASSFTHGTGNQYTAKGFLTIRGVKKPVILNFTLQIAGDKAHMSGTADAMRLDWGLGAGPEWSGEKPVSHKVGVFVDLNATKAR
ncbi:MAG: YceI family protein [Rhizomicrobium sp.]